MRAEEKLSCRTSLPRLRAMGQARSKPLLFSRSATKRTSRRQTDPSRCRSTLARGVQDCASIDTRPIAAVTLSPGP